MFKTQSNFRQNKNYLIEEDFKENKAAESSSFNFPQ